MKMNDYERIWDNKKRRWVYKHREVVEQFLGRKLLSSEHVHHKDGNHRNNDIENLEIVTASEHVIIHKPALKNKKCSIDGCDNKNHAKNMCNKHYMFFLRNK